MILFLVSSILFVFGIAAEEKCGTSQVTEGDTYFNYTWTIKGFGNILKENSHSVHNLQTGNITFHSDDPSGIWVFGIIKRESLRGLILEVTYIQQANETDGPLQKNVQVTPEVTVADKTTKLNTKFMSCNSQFFMPCDYRSFMACNLRSFCRMNTAWFPYEKYKTLEEADANIDELIIKYHINMNNFKSIFAENSCR